MLLAPQIAYAVAFAASHQKMQMMCRESIIHLAHSIRHALGSLLAYAFSPSAQQGRAYSLFTGIAFGVAVQDIRGKPRSSDCGSRASGNPVL